MFSRVLTVSSKAACTYHLYRGVGANGIIAPPCMPLSPRNRPHTEKQTDTDTEIIKSIYLSSVPDNPSQIGDLVLTETLRFCYGSNAQNRNVEISRAFSHEKPTVPIILILGTIRNYRALWQSAVIVTDNLSVKP